MRVEIFYSKEVDKFIENNQNLISKIEIEKLIILSIKKITKIEVVSIDVMAMKGNYNGYFRIRKGKLRIIFRINLEMIHIVTVEKIDFRGSVYK